MLEIASSFPGKERNEAVYIFLRPHYFNYLSGSFMFALIFIASLFFQYSFSQGMLANSLGDAGTNTAVIVIGLMQLVCAIVFLVYILDNYLDILIVTDRRLVSIRHESLFYRKISELNLEDVEDANSVVSSFFQTFLDFGNVTVQTAGASENFILTNFPHPREIVSIINDLSKQAKDGRLQHERIPESEIIGVINNAKVRSMDELREAGAIMTDDPRRQRLMNSGTFSPQRNAPR